ncbi:anthranilate synthase component I [Thermocrinis albus DSM 14484]|uniref:Anthranilate synthase component 1 n=1 Tax=Thermocrinis albus (strain DSM 14484 / JCM 11386 / HI 11/12) TaxID=638303 RepID=D3SN51_THEAH|nr:anthranilate synthase component I [Thermocrinis albus]ADC90181.1 anthranilate synthase component I [Thermocrinis albus DSM 14484]
MDLNISLQRALELTTLYRPVALYTEVLADTETPLSLFLKLRKEGAFNILLESAEGGSQWGRYSFIIRSESFYWKLLRKRGEVFQRGRFREVVTEDPFGELNKVMSTFQPYRDPSLPRFWGGLVGYVSYDVVKHYEPVRDSLDDPLMLPDIMMVLTDLVVIHDNLTGKVKVVVPLFESSVEEYRRGERTIEDTLHHIFHRSVLPSSFKEKEPSGWTSNTSQQEFIDMVTRAKEYIAAGDVIQVVLSQRFYKSWKGDPQNIYRVLRYINPSPYMYYLDMGSFQVIGSSPEVLVRVEDKTAHTRPIAGTRRRGRTEEEDVRLEEELVKDEKERAEHLMLVDLARNDLARVCVPGSVKVKEFMKVERYSHVMHMVSHVDGILAEGVSPFDVLKAVFPAGTVSGAPKVRAMQIIEELEKERRGIYAGSVGYVSFEGNMDMAIAIRTAVYRGGEIFVQAGAGIVADSDPYREWLETVNKAKAVMKAVDMASSV